MAITYKQIREKTPLESLTRWPIADHLCYLMSPIVSIPFIKHHVKPNTITMMMIVSGIIGGILFALPYLSCKIMAIVAYWLWFVFDCSDGEVARFTQTFSKYGKQLDWVAHLTCHPLCVMAIWLSFRQQGKFDMDLISITSIMLVSCELIRRNLTALYSLLSVDSEMGLTPSLAPSLPRWCLAQIMYFPNFVLIYPLIYVICIYLQWDGISYVYYIWAGLNCLYVIRDITRFTFYIFKS